MVSQLTIITGPSGVDIGPVAARLGRNLDDGLAIRVVTPDTQPHTSPDPYHRIAGTPEQAGGSVGAVRLDCLPSAWQNPDTNLGVVYPGHPDINLSEDLHTMDALGLNPAHRLTVQHGTGREHPISIPRPVEVGNLGVIARDSVLRTGGKVQIEAGGGQTFLSALATVGIPPWAEWIGHLDRWIVLDAADSSDELTADPTGLRAVLPGAIQRHVEQLDGASGSYHNGQFLDGVTLRVALLNAQMLVPDIAAHNLNAATGEGDMLSSAALMELLDTVAHVTGVEIHLIGTGRIAGTGVWSWIDSGERTGS